MNLIAFDVALFHSFNLDQRLANLLLTHASSDGGLRMTQQTIAGHLGTSREVITRLMQGFTARGLVATGRGRSIQPSLPR